MTDEDLGYLPATVLRSKIKTKEISPVEVTEAVLRRIEQFEPKLNAFITVAAEEAMGEAKAAEDAVMSGDELGPLHGVPYTVKDLLNTKGVRTTFASHGFADNVPSADCAAVGRLRAAGGIMIGKTTTPEFGHMPMTQAPLFGKSRNPWNLERTCGGSSGGAGAAAAAGLGPLHVGTDGGGSVRIPAAACGTVGMKQSLGVVPHDMTPDSFACMSYIGPMTRTVADCALMLDVMAGPHARDVHSLGRELTGLAESGNYDGDLKALKIGWRTTLGNNVVDTDTQSLFHEGVQAFAEAGADLRPHDAPFESSLSIWAPLTFTLWNSRFDELEQKLGDKMSETLRHWMAEGRSISAVDVQNSIVKRTEIFRQIESWFEDVDLILMPTLSRPAISVDHDPRQAIEIEGQTVDVPRAAWYPYTHPFNLTGHPAITVPCGWTEDGLPVGLQIVGPWLGDARVLQAAAVFERLRPWSDRRPDLG